ncbi:MAG: dTDP-4-dehydrorhamnose reductase [Lachnospiraceae bacterium]|jgi:dTDP-4-dehydrorhamnose reductase|nr:dTDP-4-dehydrorhamnose reductase [Lachnospiraceae bacterium]MBR4412376.1 dTDP-4-dehydrorhamnose reductase [Lachnospiraceae bacterium]MBR5067707.1 dTDP-4-dehydrorhamnose reductase [Lachnospiraceae bacterium]MBR5917152.1 dTDP-4-dehydrorhamnose reductase [Lachnospiraceae bacterium]
MIKLLITGGNGQLGRAINNLYKDRADIECINTDVGELDITNLDEVLAFVETNKPYAIINCAAHTAVDLCEDQEELAYKINAIGPRNLSIAAEKNGAKILHISTDYVFAGDATKPYKEFDTPAPQGVYGATKLAGENFVKEFSTRYFIIRTAWLYGDGKNFVKTMLRLAEDRDEIGVVYDQVGSPTSTFELAKAMDSLLFTENYGTFHGTCEGVCSWADFAEEIFKIAGKNVKVNRLTSDQYPAKAKRPAYSVLENYMFKITNGFMFADWHDALNEYMEWLNKQ